MPGCRVSQQQPAGVLALATFGNASGNIYDLKRCFFSGCVFLTAQSRGGSFAEMTMVGCLRLRYSTLCAFMILGTVEAAWAPMIPYVKARFALDEGSLGALLLCTGLGSFVALPLAGALCARLGCRRLVCGSAVLLATCLLVAALSPVIYLVIPVLLLFGMASTGTNIGINVNAVLVEAALKKPLMSGFHGGYSLGTLIGASLVSLLLTAGLKIAAAALLVWFLTALAVLLFRRGLFTGSSVQKSADTGAKCVSGQSGQDAAVLKASTRFLMIPPLVLVVGGLCFIMYGSEGAVLSWSGVFASQERGMDLRHAGFIYTAFACAMTLMRLLGNRIVAVIGPRKTVTAGSVLVAAGFLMVALVPHAVGTAAGFALAGLGAANIVPQLVSFTGRISPVLGIPVNRAIAVINAVGYSGSLMSPVIIGHVAEATSLSTAFIGISVLTLLVGLVCFRILRPQGSTAVTAEPET